MAETRPEGTTAQPSPGATGTQKIPSSPTPAGQPGQSPSPPPQAPAAGQPIPPEIDLIKQRQQRNKEEDEKRGESQAARSGAQAVADAVAKVAQAAVNAAAGAVRTGEDLDFTVTGSPGGRFRIEGPARSFGTSGVVLFGGRQVETDGWSAEKIYGKLPADVPTNVEVLVRVDENTERKGYFRG